MSLIDGSQCPNNELLALENQSRKAAAEFVTSLKKSFSSSAGAFVPGSDFSQWPTHTPVADFGGDFPICWITSARLLANLDTGSMF